MSPESISQHSIEKTLEAARGDARLLFVKQRALFAASITGLLLVAVRGLVAIAYPARAGAPLVATALALVVVAAAITFVAALRARLAMERVARDIRALELVLDASLHETSPRVELHPYRKENGEGEPTVVVRTDALDRVTAGAVPPRRASLGWMGRALAAAAVLGALLAGVSIFASHGSSSLRRWTFLEDTSDPAALGFAALATDASRAGEWLLADHDTATGARALVNRAGEEAAPPATLLVGSVHARDVRAATRCKVAVPEGDGCGLVFRYRDIDDHHLVRLDFTGRRLVIARVAGGVERELGAVPARVDGAVWQEIAVYARGDRIRATCNGRDVLDVTDPTAAIPGSVGLWAPAVAEAYFDELSVETLPASPQALEILPILGKTSGLLLRAPPSQRGGDGTSTPNALAILPAGTSLVLPVADDAAFSGRSTVLRDRTTHSASHARGPPLHA